MGKSSNVSLCVQDEMIAYVRRKSAAFSRGRSKYRGVSGQAGRWEARIGAYCGRKNVSLLCTITIIILWSKDCSLFNTWGELRFE